MGASAEHNNFVQGDMDMDTDSVGADVDSVRDGLSLLDPLVDRILVDAMAQLQGWLRIYGKSKEQTAGRTDRVDLMNFSLGLRRPTSGVRGEAMVATVGVA